MPKKQQAQTEQLKQELNQADVPESLHEDVLSLREKVEARGMVWEKLKPLFKKYGVPILLDIFKSLFDDEPAPTT